MKKKLVQTKDRRLAEAMQQLRQQVSSVYISVCMCICSVCCDYMFSLQVTEIDELVRAKDKELARAQQHVSYVAVTVINGIGRYGVQKLTVTKTSSSSGKK